METFPRYGKNEFTVQGENRGCRKATFCKKPLPGKVTQVTKSLESNLQRVVYERKNGGSQQSY